MVWECVCALSSSNCAKWLLHMYSWRLNASAFKLCAMSKYMIFLCEVIFMYRTSVTTQRKSQFEKTQQEKAEEKKLKKLQTQKFCNKESSTVDEQNSMVLLLHMNVASGEWIALFTSRSTGEVCWCKPWAKESLFAAFMACALAVAAKATAIVAVTAECVSCFTIGLNWNLFSTERIRRFFAPTSCALILSG